MIWTSYEVILPFSDQLHDWVSLLLDAMFVQNAVPVIAIIPEPLFSASMCGKQLNSDFSNLTEVGCQKSNCEEYKIDLCLKYVSSAEEGKESVVHGNDLMAGTSTSSLKSRKNSAVYYQGKEDVRCDIECSSARAKVRELHLEDPCADGKMSALDADSYQKSNFILPKELDGGESYEFPVTDDSTNAASGPAVLHGFVVACLPKSKPSTSKRRKQFKSEQPNCAEAGCLTSNYFEYSPSVNENAIHKVDSTSRTCRGSPFLDNVPPNPNNGKHDLHSRKQYAHCDVSSSRLSGIPPMREQNNADSQIRDLQGEDIQSVECSSSNVVANQYTPKISLDSWVGRSSLASSARDDGGTVNGNDAISDCVCKVCNGSDSPLKMLVCDHCEEAFHLSCCIPEVKDINFDEWYCENCKKKKRKPLLGITKRGNPPKILQGASGYKKKLWDGSSSLSSMLDDTEPYDSAVRIGAAFQAKVPEWSGPAISDTNSYGEAEELDVVDSLRLQAKNPSVSAKQKSISNWLQCMEVVNDTKDCGKVVICAKWRRAPLFEVQTDDWDCSCSVVWDPTHSDCAVPQEMSTKDVMLHLKYVKLLKERLASKKRKNFGEQDGAL